ncbi:hypothetical protein ACJRO7_015616 [Eucalyptus globulus]|uniref:SWIM-type domain-containing protein n=1 Tax=Eucalyptus globulus TaxID=34317 RepID=A0ABD3L4J3_EUCGL
MKGREAKAARMEDILNLPVQDPPRAEFSASQLKWVKIVGGRQGGDDVALIPFARVEDFVKGESSNADCPASFRVESRRRRREGSTSKPRVDGYIEYTLYWCSYGPEDYRDNESVVGDSLGMKPLSGKGSRPGRHHMMRGCLCHFTVKRLYIRPSIALIIYNQQKHVDKTGAPCHGLLDRHAVGTRAMYAPRISEELRQKVMSMLYAAIPIDDIMQHHMELVQRHGGPLNRDDFLSRNDVRNMERLVHNSSHELNENDECSVKIWVRRHQKYVFFYQERTDTEPFIMGIQTKWQLEQMLHYGRNGSIAMHSSFGRNKLKYPLCTLLAFNTSHSAIPVAWIISSSLICQGIHKWIGPLAERIYTKDPTWQLSSFLVDDCSFKVSLIREAFRCRVLLCLWHVRRAWIRNLIKRSCHSGVQREMFRLLGSILYCTRSNAVEEFMQVFVDQCAFMEYFRERWLPRIDALISGMKSLPTAGPEPQAAIESYHLRSKFKLLDIQYCNLWLRVDWLIHMLATEYHSSFWLDQYSLGTGCFENVRDPSFTSSAWHRALNILDVNVILEEQNLLLAKVLSEDRNSVYTVWNPGSEFSLCDCAWSKRGNLCEHVIKVAFLCRTRQFAGTSLGSQGYRQAMLSLLQKPPGDPIVLDHANLRVTQLHEDVNSLEELSNSGLLQRLPAEADSQMADYVRLFPPP